MPVRDIFLVLMVPLVWGVNFTMVKLTVGVLPPMVANSCRFTIVALVLLPFLKLVPGRMKDLLTVAFTLGVMHFGAVFTAMKLAGSVGAVSIASELCVPFSTLLAVLVLGERVGWKRILGIILSFAGVLVIGFDPAVFTYWDALLVMSFSAFAYSVATILMRRLKDVHPFTTQAWVGLAGALGSVLLSAIFENGQIAALSGAGLVVWGGVLYSALGSSIAGHGTVNYLLTKHEVSAVSPYFLLTPLFAILGGMVFLGEELSWRIALGGGLTLLGVLIVTLRNQARTSAAAELVAELE